MPIRAVRYAPKSVAGPSAPHVETAVRSEALKIPVQKNSVSRIPYTSAIKPDMAVCIVFFSPVGFQRPIDNFVSVCEDMLRARFPTFVLELLRPGQASQATHRLNPQGSDKDFLHITTIESDSVLFAKENLQNLLARRVPRTFQKLCFIDADIYFDTADWYQRCSSGLDVYDVLQPFEHAKWLNKDNNTNNAPSKLATAKILAKHAEPRFDLTHPGFAWAFKRSAFEKIGGYYEGHFAGGGDIAFATALVGKPLDAFLPPTLAIDAAPMRTPSWDMYARNVKATQLQIGYLPEITALHMYHGPYFERKYGLRCNFLPQRDTSGEYPVRRRGDGLLEWADPAHSKKMEDYFKSRREDD